MICSIDSFVFIIRFVFYRNSSYTDAHFFFTIIIVGLFLSRLLSFVLALIDGSFSELIISLLANSIDIFFSNDILFGNPLDNYSGDANSAKVTRYALLLRRGSPSSVVAKVDTQTAVMIMSRIDISVS